MKKLFLLIIIICFIPKGNSQSEIHNYKYVVVPLQYDFLKGKNVYRLNTLTKYLFKQEGFEAYFTEEELPQDLFHDRCLAMYADVKEVRGGFRKRKLEIILKDCYGNIIMKSEVGDSTLNNHQNAHHEALREAFVSIKMMDYEYKPKTPNPSDSENLDEIKPQVREGKIKGATGETKEVAEFDDSGRKEVGNIGDFYAEMVNNGFRILDSDSKIVMVLLYTDAKDVFIVKDKNAVVIKKAGKWLYSENDGINRTSKIMNIKF